MIVMLLATRSRDRTLKYTNWISSRVAVLSGTDRQLGNPKNNRRCHNYKIIMASGNDRSAMRQRP